jgi:biopolymer transport protein ExbB
MDLVQKFVDGGAFMYPILACLIIGLAYGIYKMITLFQSSINTKEFVLKVRNALDEGGVESALHVCENTKGPVASIFHAGLSRIDRGVEASEKAVVNAGSIEMAFLEKGMIVMSTMIVLAPMLGFTGTVAGMVAAFADIKAANDISPAVVAGGIEVALLTTLFGLIVAMIVQLFYNFFTSKIDSLIVDMEESSLILLDDLVELEKK